MSVFPEEAGPLLVAFSWPRQSHKVTQRGHPRLRAMVVLALLCELQMSKYI